MSEDFCTHHSEKLKLFCVDHQCPVCVICRDSKAHSGHRFKPVDEAAREYGQETQDALALVLEKRQTFEKVKENYDRTAKHILVQSLQTERQIREEIKKLHQFLEEEERVRIAALKKEEKQKTRVMTEKIKDVEKEIQSLSETIQSTIKDLESGEVPFLNSYVLTVEKIHLSLLLDDPKLIPGALIDQTKHLGNLRFHVWTNMKDLVSFSPVILDPNTAHPDLVLSHDLTGLRRDEKQEVPENPERILSYPAVLGSEGFDSKTHIWDVEVGDGPVWGVGVSEKPTSTGTDKKPTLLKISLCDDKYTADSSQNASTALAIKTKPRRVRVHLDCDRKRVTFSDADANTNIHTFTHSCTDRLFPYLNCAKQQQTLKITPTKVSVEPNAP